MKTKRGQILILVSLFIATAFISSVYALGRGGATRGMLSDRQQKKVMQLRQAFDGLRQARASRNAQEVTAAAQRIQEIWNSLSEQVHRHIRSKFPKIAEKIENVASHFSFKAEEDSSSVGERQLGTFIHPHRDKLPRQSISMPFGIVHPPIEKICEYSMVVYERKYLFDAPNKFNPRVLQKARSCGTKVVLRLHGKTRDVLNDNGIGLALDKYEDRINDFAGLIDPYVEDGTIIAHVTIDEPHDAHDWGFRPPEPSEVDQAGAISKKYWPNLPTLVNTIPRYASRYQWEHTDIINFQYAYHKGPLNKFVEEAVNVLERGHVRDISWSMMVALGGGEQYGQGPMSPEQAVEVGTTMCATGKGVFIGFYGYNERLINEDMRKAINKIQAFCGDLPPSSK